MGGTTESGVALDPEVVEVVVVDANAVIHSAGDLSSMLPSSLRQKALEGKLRLVTMPDVVAEVRDKKSREALTSKSAVFELQLKEPTEEAKEAVRSFARKTGDIHVLSVVDLNLIALAYDLEREVSGSVGHLRQEPLPTSNVENTSSRRNRKYQVKMPGWDPEANHDEEWGSKEEAEAQERESRIKYSQMEIDGDLGVQVSAAEAPTQARSAGVSPSARAVEPLKVVEDEDGNDEEEARARGITGPQHQDDGGDDDDGWETARKSKNAQRKQKRKQWKRQNRQEEEEELAREADAAPMPAPEADDMERDGPVSHPIALGDSHATTSSDLVVPTAVASAVVSLTGDYAMQNVLLQMGLQVAGPKSGMLITEVRKFGVRCHACGFSTDDLRSLSNDIFCPKCGNMNTLDRCQILVGSDGQVTFVQLSRKKVSLKGTQYSLPQPRTGRNANNPILREDNLKIPKRKPKPNMDAFSPEYNEETWHRTNGLDSISGKLDDRQANYLEQVKQSVKKNPNARKLTRTNRRR